MPPIETLRLYVKTGDVGFPVGADTDGHVYLGVCGREFRINTPEDDFELGAGDTIRFGKDDNVENGWLNDPRQPQLFVEQADQFPVYLRYDPHPRDDDWVLEHAYVTFNDDSFPMYETLLRGTLQMGHRSTLFVHLVKHEDTPASSSKDLMRRVARFIRSTDR
ncbi:hypothetical protein C474_18740 [Halogeometricum pallidum JCM 14848]|uniref:Uncharacterized protein n=1 Tax=Halogeometricum pallidum JCM 14848 TaxID=1227487 RepID=M0CW88_HALPD|nr:hypothetical protein [Halogeometricum pallidum]ELZ26707.1 hypothetical protein C474_18740 [Halogeometricum pallidum JCM 14848]